LKDSLIPWEVEIMNTCPHNFVWEKEKTGIIVVASGLYEVSFGFFGRLKPEVSLLVNGEAVIVSTMAKEKKYVHSSSNVTGKVFGINRGRPYMY
jgi:hypothetical protein